MAMQLNFLSSAKQKLSSKAQAVLENYQAPSNKRKGGPTNEKAAPKQLANKKLKAGAPSVNAPDSVHSPIDNHSDSGNRNSDHDNVDEDRMNGKPARDGDGDASEGGDNNGSSVGDNDADADQLTPKDELEQLMKEWVSPVYAFFELEPKIIENDGRRAHQFKCAARGCKVKVCHCTNMKDANLILMCRYATTRTQRTHARQVTCTNMSRFARVGVGTS
ncbi:hypothetical protein EV363DRAFT_1165918 [Boletus edulis]|nr:hypothetical protein EV363DRAFT_1165918 [Boletus edulis]